MNNQAAAVQVKILDKEYQVNCPPPDQEALMKSARFLDESMRKIKDRGNIHGAEKIAVMAAFAVHTICCEKAVRLMKPGILLINKSGA